MSTNTPDDPMTSADPAEEVPESATVGPQLPEREHLLDDGGRRRIRAAAAAVAVVFVAVGLAALLWLPGVWRLVCIPAYLAGIVAAVVAFRQGGSAWRNPELFLPGELGLGSHGTARYRHEVHHGAGDEEVSAALRCVERVGRDDVATVHSSRPKVRVARDIDGDLVEVDIELEIPVHGVPPTLGGRAMGVDWRLEVDVRAGRHNQTASFDVFVAAEHRRTATPFAK